MAAADQQADDEEQDGDSDEDAREQRHLLNDLAEHVRHDVLHVGGNGGIKVRATDFLCKVETEEQVLEHCGAYLQLYREEARYLERTAPWIERVGLGYVKARVVEDRASRKALYARFLESQRYAQVDPWAERARGKDAEEFAPLVPAAAPDALANLGDGV